MVDGTREDDTVPFTNGAPSFPELILIHAAKGNVLAVILMCDMYDVRYEGA
jgi:hypothetical protein